MDVLILWLCLFCKMVESEIVKFSSYSPTCDVAVTATTIIQNITGLNQLECAVKCNHLSECVTIAYGKYSGDTQDNCYLLNTDCINIVDIGKPIIFRFKQDKELHHWINVTAITEDVKVAMKTEFDKMDILYINLTKELESSVDERKKLNLTIQDLNSTIYVMTEEIYNLKALVQNATTELDDLKKKLESLFDMQNNATLDRNDIKTQLQTTSTLATTENDLRQTEITNLQTVLTTTNTLLDKVAKPFNALPQNSRGENYYWEALNYYDHIALSICSSIKSTGYVFQVRRTCSRDQPTCDYICANRNLTDYMANYSKGFCYHAVHIYKTSRSRGNYVSNIVPETDNQMNVYSHRYSASACASVHCGPNYCCCTVGN